METRQKTYVKCLIAKRQNKCNGGVCRWEMNFGKVQFVAKKPTSWYKQTSKTRITDPGSRSFNGSEWQQTFHKQ